MPAEAHYVPAPTRDQERKMITIWMTRKMISGLDAAAKRDKVNRTDVIRSACQTYVDLLEMLHELAEKQGTTPQDLLRRAWDDHMGRIREALDA